MRASPRPWLIPPGSKPGFPDPNLADSDGLLAVGGDLAPERLMSAYEVGVFPWYEQGLPPLWWSPDPRAIIEPWAVRMSRSMRREIRRSKLSVTFNRAFRQVMSECGRMRKGGTWITREMLDAYCALHEMGAAHSVEVFDGAKLVGGLYGVQRGRLFAAESMFHRATNASKLALLTCTRVLFEAGVELFDVQFLTDHLVSLGATEISRASYLARTAHAARAPLDLSGLGSVDGLRALRQGLA